MAHMSRMNCFGATLLVAFVLCGCQTSNNKWTAWKDRSKPKSDFQDPETSEEVTYWPNKPNKSNPKMTEVPRPLKDKMARKSEQSKRDAQLAELLKEGDQLRKNGQFEDARLVYTKALLTAPENPDVNHRLAVIADKQHDYKAADQYYQAVLRVRPRDVNLLSDLGYSYSMRGNSQRAEQTLKEALTIDPSHKFAMANLGMIYAQQNRYQEALEMLRRGSTETEAQSYMATLFPQGGTMPVNGVYQDQLMSHVGPAVAPGTRDNLTDLSKYSWDDIQREMAKRRQEAQRQRQLADQQSMAQERNAMADERAMQQLPNSKPWNGQQIQGSPQSPNQQSWMAQEIPGNPRTNPPGGQMSLGPQGSDRLATANLQPGYEPPDRQLATTIAPGPGGQGQMMALPQRSLPADSLPRDPSLAATTSTPQGTQIFRGSGGQSQSGRSIDPQNLNIPANNIQQTNASQMATQLGMSAGPGSMFPIVPGSSTDGIPAAGSSSSYENRFGSEFQQTPRFQNAPNWSGNMPQGQSSLLNQSGQDNGIPNVAPSSPISNWDSPTSGALNWQAESPHSPDASPDNSFSTGGGKGTNSNGGPAIWEQGTNRRAETIDNYQPSINPYPSVNPNRSPIGNEGARPYNGAWPQNNTLPPRQNQPVPMNARSPESMEMMGIDQSSRGSVSIPNVYRGGESIPNAYQDSANSNPSNGSVPQWPYSPNR